jgi:hypothetical protein
VRWLVQRGRDLHLGLHSRDTGVAVVLVRHIRDSTQDIPEARRRIRPAGIPGTAAAAHTSWDRAPQKEHHTGHSRTRRQRGQAEALPEDPTHSRPQREAAPPGDRAAVTER